MSLPLRWTMKFWDQFCYTVASHSATLGSVTLQEVFFSWGDLDSVIEMGMPERTIDVSSLHAVVGSHLAEKLREFAVLFISDGEDSNSLHCGDLAWHSSPLSTCPSPYFLMDNISRGLAWIYNEVS